MERWGKMLLFVIYWDYVPHHLVAFKMRRKKKQQEQCRMYVRKKPRTSVNPRQLILACFFKLL